jgi:RNA polymerase-binding transcription factor DksA
MSLNPEFVEEMKKRLTEEKTRLEAELTRFAKPTGEAGQFETKMENIGTDVEDNATEVEEYVDDLGLEQSLEAQLRDVYDALEKIEKGAYGVCEKTGEVIPVDRLRAYPAARTAIH